VVINDGDHARSAGQSGQSTSALPQSAASTPSLNEAEIAQRAQAKADEELERVLAVQRMCRAGRVGQSFEDELVRGRVSVAESSKRIFAEMERVAKESGAGQIPPRGGEPTVSAGDRDDRKVFRDGLTNALLHRADAGRNKLDDNGRRFVGMTLLDMGRAALAATGRSTEGWNRPEVASHALGLQVRSYNSTSDFPLILADVAGKSLRQAYEAAPQTFAPIVRRVVLPDFKPVKRTQFGEAPALTKVLEGGEYTRSTIGEGREVYSLSRYGKIFPITWEAIVNDDLDAFTRVPGLFGQAARNLESDLVWEQITSNPDMSDSVALFHADHGNLASSGAAPGITTLSAARAAMRAQTGLNGTQKINVMPRYLIVPVALETLAEQLVSPNLVAAQATNINVFSGKLQVIAEPRLDDEDDGEWYVAADPGQIDMIEAATLEGQGDGPYIETRIGFERDGMEIKARHVFAARVIDHRGFYKNPGA
jgi:hypothetical protein